MFGVTWCSSWTSGLLCCALLPLVLPFPLPLLSLSLSFIIICQAQLTSAVTSGDTIPEVSCHSHLTGASTLRRWGKVPRKLSFLPSWSSPGSPEHSPGLSQLWKCPSLLLKPKLSPLSQPFYWIKRFQANNLVVCRCLLWAVFLPSKPKCLSQKVLGCVFLINQSRGVCTEQNQQEMRPTRESTGKKSKIFPWRVAKAEVLFLGNTNHLYIAWISWSSLMIRNIH